MKTFSVVGHEATFSPGAFACPFDGYNLAPTNSNLLETFSSPNSPANHGTHGDLDDGAHGYCVASPKEQIRKLADILLPGQPAKVHYPRLHQSLLKHCPHISARRIRSIYNGEVTRLWDDEHAALTLALNAAENAKRRAEFARTAASLAAGLEAAGHPLSPAQARTLVRIIDKAA